MLLQKNLQIYVKTTETCNLNCSHCFTSGSKGKKIFFNPAASFHYICKLVDNQGLKSLNIVFHGGEPLMAPVKDIKKLIDLVNSLPTNVTLGLQTNLVYPLTKEKLKLINENFLTGIGTSWDYEIRFGSVTAVSREKQKSLWEKNVRTLLGHGHKITLFVSLTKGLIENKRALDIVEYAISLGLSYIQFERITSDGNAKDSEIIPSNREIDSWILELYQVTIENKLYKKINNMFLSELSQSVLTANHTGNRCRNCEQSIITMNADGSLAGCPNSASGQSWGHISKTTETFIKSPERLKAIASELSRKDECLTCEVQGICNGDCYKLAWDENCPAPKSLMKLMKNEPIQTLEQLRI